MHQASFFQKLDFQKVQCRLCHQDCLISPEAFGFCGVRQNKQGALYTYTYNRPIASAVDPIEKKPLYHFLPGSKSYSVACAGCNFKCGFCQNWQISQASRRTDLMQGRQVSAKEIVDAALNTGCKSISYTYTEPTIFFEYAFDISRSARQSGLSNIFVTNGYMSKDALEQIRPFLDAANIDLKSFSDDFYKKVCAATLAPVLENIRLMYELGIWIEITTLLIPGLNDSEDEISKIAGFIASVGAEIPWHISRFHPDYRLQEYPQTPITQLRKAYDIGRQKGLRYVYMGNVFEGNDTYCYNCKTPVIIRKGFSSDSLLLNGGCPNCGSKIDGKY